MKPINILHISDVHLDSKIGGLDSQKSTIRRTEMQTTLKRAMEQFSDADIVLIAGDLFDGVYNESTVKYLCKLFSEYHDKHIFVVGGNHDYLGLKSMAQFIQQKPQNVVVFGDSVSCTVCEDLGVRVYGASFNSPSVYTSLLSGFTAENDSLVNIMLIHGEIENGEKYNPIDTKAIAKSGLDYMALGHTHTFSQIKKAGDTYYAYSGIPEPRGFDECGKCGVVYGQISKGECKLNFYPISARQYEIIDFDITGFVTDAEVVYALSQQIDEKNIYRINLKGTKNGGFVPNTQNISQMLNAFYCEVFDLSKSEADIMSFLGDNSLKGLVASELANISKSDQYNEKTIKDATEILASLLIGGDINK